MMTMMRRASWSKQKVWHELVATCMGCSLPKRVEFAVWSMDVSLELERHGPLSVVISIDRDV